jgi:hypothetical protein
VTAQVSEEFLSVDTDRQKSRICFSESISRLSSTTKPSFGTERPLSCRGELSSFITHHHLFVMIELGPSVARYPKDHKLSGHSEQLILSALRAPDRHCSSGKSK